MIQKRFVDSKYLEVGDEVDFVESIAWILAAERPLPGLDYETLCEEASRIATLPTKPLISLFVTLADGRAERLRDLILSVRCQSYANWELVVAADPGADENCRSLARKSAMADPRVRLVEIKERAGRAAALNLAIANSSGEWLMIVDHDGVLHPSVLGLFVREWNTDPSINLTYANEAEIDPGTKQISEFLAKPDLDLFTLLRSPYLGRPVAMRRDLVEQVSREHLFFRPEHEGVLEHDLFLRLALCDRLHPLHLPLFCYYHARTETTPWAIKANSTEALTQTATARAALLREFVPRVHPNASWTCNLSGLGEATRIPFLSLWLSAIKTKTRPSLLIVIPVQGNLDALSRCLDAIEAQDHELDIRVALFETLPDNFAEDSAALHEWLARPRRNEYIMSVCEASPNFASLTKLANRAIAQHPSDLILLLGENIELDSPKCLQVLAVQLLADRRAGFIGVNLRLPGIGKNPHQGWRSPETDREFNDQNLANHSPVSHIGEEAICTVVSMSCAMARVETFRDLFAAREPLFDPSLVDLDMSLAMLASGHRNYCFATLVGIRREADSPIVAPADSDLMLFQYHHSAQLLGWKRNQLRRSFYPQFAPRYLIHDVPDLIETLAPRVAATLVAADPTEASAKEPVPLRHRAADKANALIKRIIGPLHRPLCSGVRVCIRIHRRLKRGPAGVLGLGLSLGRRLLGPIPLVGPLARMCVRIINRIMHPTRSCAKLFILLLKSPRNLDVLRLAFRIGGSPALLDQARLILAKPPTKRTLNQWFHRTRPSSQLLASFKARVWPEDAPLFSILTPVYNVREDWLRQAVGSVLNQTYPNWELILIDDASSAPHIKPTLDHLGTQDPRIRLIHNPTNQGVSRATNIGLAAAGGDYVAFMDHDDYLEPHALQRFAEAVLADRPDLLYSDEALTGSNIDEIIDIPIRLAFSYDYYLCHPYYVHLIAVKTALVRKVGGLDENMTVSQDVDLGLRLIEVSQRISHVPDVLYRWRMHHASLSHRQVDQVQRATRGALQRHLARLGIAARVNDESHHNFRDIVFATKRPAFVGIIVHGHERAEELARCIKNLERTVPPDLAEIVVLASPSRSNRRRSDVEALAWKQKVEWIENPLSPAALLNEGVKRAGQGFTHYLFLDETVEAIEPGWLEHMLGFAQRSDVGIVGAFLFDELERVRHAGLIVGLFGSIGRAHAGESLRSGVHHRNPGRNGELLCSRDVSAVSSACMLVKHEVFHSLEGFDERFVANLHDADFCLRARAEGHKAIQDAAVLLCQHEESNATASTHASDLELFQARYETIIRVGDPYFSPLHSNLSTRFDPSPLARSEAEVAPRTIRIVLPRSHSASTRTLRFDAAEPAESRKSTHITNKQVIHHE